MITISPKVAQLSMGGKHPNSISSSSLSSLKKQSLFTTPIFYTIQSANNKVGLSFYLSTLATCLGLCFNQLAIAQTISPFSSLPPSQPQSQPLTATVYTSPQSVNVTTDLTQVINHNSSETGAPVILATGADITVNIGNESNLTAEGTPGDEFRAVDISISHTEESKALGISPKAIINSSGSVQGIRVEGISETTDSVATPITINVNAGKVYGNTFAIFVNQFRSTEDSSTTININNAEVFSTGSNSAAIYVFGNQPTPELVNINIGKNGYLYSNSGLAFVTIGDATIKNEGKIHGTIRIDALGRVNNYGEWLVGAKNQELYESTASEILNLGNMGLLPFNQATLASYTGNITNGSIIQLSNGFAGDTVTINGNLNSLEGSAIYLDVNLLDDNSPKDKLIINGSTSGNSKVYIHNLNGTGGQTVNGIQIISVQLFSYGVFTLGAPVQAGNYEYFLHKLGNDYYLISSLSPKPVKPTPIKPSKITTATNTQKITPLVLRPAVTAFSMAPAINFETNLNLLGQASDRLKAKSIANNSFQSVWAQTGFSHHNLKTNAHSNTTPLLDSSQINSQLNTSFLQIGTDVWSKVNTPTNQRQSIHVLAGIAQTHADISNPDRAKAGLNINTAKLNSTVSQLGLEYQTDFETGMYVNSVASVGQIRNSFTDIYGGQAKQSGTGLNYSIEAGRPFQLAQWTLEPQVQLSYQHLHLNAFKDAISSIESHSTKNLRLRVGAKLSQKDWLAKGSEFFTQINLLQDHQSNKGINISYENINAQPSEKPWVNLAIGASYQTGATQLKAKLGLEKSLSGNSKNGVQINLALNHSF